VLRSISGRGAPGLDPKVDAMSYRVSFPVAIVLVLPLFGVGCAAKSGPEPAAPGTMAAGAKGESAAGGADAPAVPPAATATAAREEAPGSVEAELLALAAAEGEIEQVLGGKAKKTVEDERLDAAARAPAGAGKAGVARPAASPAKPADNRGASCSLACSALASMSRAVSHLCSLAGEGDRRCEDGRSRERAATQRVHASCPSCSG
jgi:hypothetical protein